MTPLLEVDGVSRSFGSVPALVNASLTVERNSITALIGPNGSGKTTLFNVITGNLRADTGRVRFDGHDVTTARPAALYRRGLSRTYQQARVFSQLTVEENLVVAGGFGLAQLFGRRVNRRDRQRATELIDEFRLGRVADLPAAELSYGQRKLLEFAAVLMSSPTLILLDEPTAGVNPVLIETMEHHIRRLHAAGITFLIVEHDMNVVMRLCDPVVVLDQGREIFTGPPDAVREHPAVLDAYLGA
ncbi:ABC transporter ATP-binding protein [Kutzneria buriramensis]|uniref:Branched-chain amino acid transport system ATP-binding protein/branched-chain amino acid transport system permease protein n=1 Tax=Kutzneria buriramensis TaxID=1045776 RepID=A0A3E0HIA7_9PSEU|nr:ABC transporter ATP-binding protein [Kutzneria buriramensis]REH46122.1 branched-chain amino acid transport system ATP-binding protein/branched-chain amino acid transport system permease protein [Kutzneria buriramensis]